MAGKVLGSFIELSPVDTLGFELRGFGLPC
jgi:hypothetical protein